MTDVERIAFEVDVAIDSLVYSITKQQHYMPFNENDKQRSVCRALWLNPNLYPGINYAVWPKLNISLSRA